MFPTSSTKILAENAEAVFKMENSNEVRIRMVEKNETENESNYLDKKISSLQYSLLAKTYIIDIITVFYLIFLIIYAIVLEFAQWMKENNTKEDENNFQQISTNIRIFKFYIYFVSFLFFGYCYFMFFKNKLLKILKPNICQKLKVLIFGLLNMGKIKSTKMSNGFRNNYLPNVESVYLWIGAIVFAILSCIYYSNRIHFGISIEINICALLFTLIQTHFLLYNSTIIEKTHPAFSSFGILHLFGTNLINWFQYLFIKNQPSENEEAECQGLECLLFGTFKTIFCTAIVKYSLICAAVLFIIWHNIGQIQNEKFENQLSSQKNTVPPLIWSSKLIFGYICSIVFLLSTLTLMAFFYIFTTKNENEIAAKIFCFTDISQNAIGIAICTFAFWKLRFLSFKFDKTHANKSHKNQMLLDMILLAHGFVGELAFSISGITGIIGTEKWQTFSYILIIAHILRIIQSTFQSFLICFLLKFKTKHCGKGTIKFLLIANISMFIFNLFLFDKASSYESFENSYGKENWMILVKIFSPLTVFFRFHSSVCFAEI